MENEAETSSSRVHVVAALFLLVVMSLWLFQVQDVWQVALLLVAGMLVVVPPLRRWSLVDGVIVLLAVCDAVSCFYGSCPVTALQQASFSVFCLVAYLAARRLFSDAKATRILFTGSYVPAVVALGITVCTFFVFRRSVLEAGFADTYHFRFLFRPLGYITNQWAEVLLVLLGWLCLARRHASVLVFLTAVVLCLSFSRGAYIALGTFVLAWLCAVRFMRDKVRVPLLCLAAFLVVWIGFPQETNTTLRMNATVSQQQSTEARVGATQAAWEAFRESPHQLFGQGNGSYSLAIDHVLNQDSTQTYTNLAPNLPVLLLTEKGWLGLLLYGLLAVCIVRELWKRRKETGTCAIGCTLLAVCVKEMTQANLFHLPFVWLALCLMLAYLQRSDIAMTEPAPRKRYLIPGLVTVFYVVFAVSVYSYKQKEKLHVEAMEAFQGNRLEEAAACMEQTGNSVPYLVQRGLFYLRCHQKTGQKDDAHRALAALTDAAARQPDDVQIRYLQACACLAAGKTGQACSMMEELVQTYPANSLYRLGLWKCLCRDGHLQTALPHLVEAVRLTPRVLTLPDIRELAQTDTTQFRALRTALSHLQLSASATPSDRARLGYIAYWNGEKEKAKVLLQQAVDDLPNLSTPWLLLGEERKYRLLLLGAFRKNLFTVDLPEEPDMTAGWLLSLFYGMKFMDWYGHELLTFEKIEL